MIAQRIYIPRMAAPVAVWLLTPSAIITPINPNSPAEAPIDSESEKKVLARNPPAVDSR